MSSTPERRQSQRVTLKKGATLIFFTPMGRVERLMCFVVDRSPDGLRLSVGSGLRPGQLVDLILDEDPSKWVRCSVTWIGNPGSKQEGQAGLQTV
jgi:PilZ domain